MRILLSISTFLIFMALYMVLSPNPKSQLYYSQRERGRVFKGMLTNDYNQLNKPFWTKVLQRKLFEGKTAWEAYLELRGTSPKTLPPFDTVISWYKQLADHKWEYCEQIHQNMDNMIEQFDDGSSDYLKRMSRLLATHRELRQLIRGIQHEEQIMCYWFRYSYFCTVPSCAFNSI